MDRPRPGSRVGDAARTVAALQALALTAPLNAAVTGAAWAAGRGRRRSTSRAREQRTVLVSGGKMTKALELARAFHAAGHRVVLVESAKYHLSGHRFSRAVAAFHTVPPPQDPAYADALVAIARAEGVDVFVPVSSPASSHHDAVAARALAEVGCETVHVDADRIDRLDDKFQFFRTARALGLSVPDTYLITDPRQVAEHDFAPHRRPMILKSIAYDPVHRLDLTPLPRPTPEETAAFAASLPISPENPWILQEYVAGTEYCTHGTVRDGRLQVWCCCESSAFQVNYEQVEKPAIRAWVERFVGELGLTGQVSFDFIETADGELFAIECNPRTHSAITMLRGHPGLAAGYLETRDERAPLVEPLAGSRPTYWLYHELWRLLTQPDRVGHNLRTLREGRDAIWDPSDPLPFLLVHHLQIPSLLVDNLRRGASWIRIDFNIGKLVEPAGD